MNSNELCEGNYVSDITYDYLLPQLESFEILKMEENAYSFSDILDAMKGIASNQRSMISEIEQLCKLSCVSPATAATSEGPFSIARRIKMWLREKITQQQVTHVAILGVHKTRTDALRLNVANEFVSRNDSH